MKWFKLIVIFINILVVLWCLKVLTYDTDSDVVGLFVVIMVGLLIIFDLIILLVRWYFR
jgi:hypothetical protein